MGISTVMLRTVAAVVLVAALGACQAVPLGDRFGNRASSTSSTTVSGGYLQGRYAASQQKYAGAAAAFARAASGDQDPELSASAFRYALVAGDFKTAEQYARIVIADAAALDSQGEGSIHVGFIDTDLPNLTLAVQAIDSGDYLAADEILRRSFRSPLGRSVSYLLSAWAIYGAQGVDGAIIQLGSAGEDVFTGFSAFQMAMMLDLDGNVEAAEHAYLQAIQGENADLAVVAYALFLERVREPARSIEFYRNMAAGRGYLRRVGRMGLARLEQPLEGETAAFLRLADKASTRLASDARSGASAALLTYAWAAYEEGAQRQATAERAGFSERVVSFDIPLSLAQMASRLDSEVGAADYIVGAIARAYSNYEMAERANRKVKPTAWLYNYAAIDRADSLVSMGKKDTAMRLIKNYLKQDALAPDVALTLAELYAGDGQYDQAIVAAGRAIAISNRLASDETRQANLWRYYFARGAILTEADRWDEAEADLMKALELAPNEPLLLNFLGYSYVERGQNLDVAFGMIERALAAMPTSGSITDSLGWAYFQRGDYAKAVEYLERAVALESTNDTITDHLGDAYWHAGRTIEARYEWRRVTELEGAEDELVESAKRKLAGEEPAAGSLVVGKIEAADAQP